METDNDGKYRWTYALDMVSNPTIFLTVFKIFFYIMLAAAKQESYTDFQRVRRVVARPRLHLIKVNERLEKNQVYVPREDFDFVLDFIRSHCPNLK